jgi:hypothetical protein
MRLKEIDFYFSFLLFGTRLGAMNIRWNDIPERIQKRLETELVKTNVHDFKNSSLSLLLKGCEFLEYRWERRNDLRQTILAILANFFRNIDDVSSKGDFLQCIRHISEFMKWRELPSDVTESMFKGTEKLLVSFGHNDFTNLLAR